MAPKATYGPNDAVKSTKTGLPRVTQHETLHTLNVQVQQTALAALRGPSQLPFVRRGCRYLQSLARKATLRLDTSIKQAICKKCFTLQLPGATCTTRVKANTAAGFVLVTTCTLCRTQRRLLRPSTQALRCKIIARKHQRRAARQAIKILQSKTSSFDSQCGARGRTHTFDIPNAQLWMRSEKPSQRTRRRAARYLHAARGGDGVVRSLVKSGDNRPRKRRRGSGRGANTPALFGSVDDIEHLQTSAGQPRRKRRKRSRQRGERVADLPPYAERLRMTEKRPDWLGADGLSNEQMALLRSMRGDHVVTRGLGRGGVVGEEV